MSDLEQSVKIVSQDNVAIIEFDLVGEKVNKLSTPVMNRLKELLLQIKSSSDYKAVVLLSKKSKIFIAGADIEEIKNLKTADEFAKAVQGGQDIFNILEDLPQPVVAAIHGACMGGGCEMILACDYRIASDDSSTRIGLPETQLGIIPGFGGCVRLPRVVGLQASLDIILAGKAVNSKKALKIGLVDQVVHQQQLLTTALKKAKEAALSGKKRQKKFQASGTLNLFLESALGRSIVFKKAKEGVLKVTKGHYPAPLKALEVIEKTYGRNQRQHCLDKEREGFCEVATTDISKNLIHVFYLTEMVKKQSGVASSAVVAKNVNTVGILGAGTMGGGIAYVAADKGMQVRMKDLNPAALGKGLKHAADLWKKLVKKKAIDSYQYQQKINLVSVATDYSGFKQIDVCVEAIVEDMQIKQKVIKETALQMRPDAIIATNTSSLSVNEMAAGHPDPRYFAGMHFFNPVHKMPLVEVIRGDRTSDETIATIYELSKRMGKMPVVVKDGPGFLVNRLLLPYMAEAAFLMQEGMSIEFVDQAFEKEFGMPMGPFELMDAVGLDVCVKVLKIFKKAFGERIEIATCMEFIEKSGRLGQKNSKGFYSYDSDGRKKMVDPTIYGDLQLAQPADPYTSEECIERGVFAMINECSLALWQDHIVETPHEVDLAMIMGTGFPPFRGGLLKYADKVGLPLICDKLQRYSQQRKALRLQPTVLLKDKKSFY